MVVVDQKAVFDPFAHVQSHTDGEYRGLVTGKVVEVNYAHKWFSVEYGCPALRTSFKFSDIGKEVRVYG